MKQFWFSVVIFVVCCLGFSTDKPQLSFPDVHQASEKICTVGTVAWLQTAPADVTLSIGCLVQMDDFIVVINSFKNDDNGIQPETIQPIPKSAVLEYHLYDQRTPEDKPKPNNTPRIVM